jgi:hypothetical protein
METTAQIKKSESTRVHITRQPESFVHNGEEKLSRIERNVIQALAAVWHAGNTTTKRAYRQILREAFKFADSATDLMPEAKHNGGRLTPIYWKLLEGKRNLRHALVHSAAVRFRDDSFNSVRATVLEAAQLLHEAVRMLCAIEAERGIRI